MSLSIDEIILGKLPRKEAGIPKFAKYLHGRTLKPRASVSRIKLVKNWPMFGNDSLGDCTCVAVGYTEMLDSAAAGQPEVPTLEQIIALYNATGSGDTGRVCADVLAYWQQHGVGPEGTKLVAYAEIDPKNIDHIKLAIELFGSVYAGVQLPNSAKAQIDSGVWTVTRGADAAPGSWGGHCVGLFDYDSRGGPACVTWSQKQRMTWQWWQTYADEAYAPISADWFNADGVAPSGFKLDLLEADLAQVQG